MGAGLNIGNKFAEMTDPKISQNNSSNDKSPASRLKQLKELLDLGAITQEEFEKKKNSILEEL